MQHGSIGTLREEVLAALNCARLDAQLDASHLDDDTTSALPDPKSSIHEILRNSSPRPGTAGRKFIELAPNAFEPVQIKGVPVPSVS
jgi:hypothetical protein